MKAQLTQAQANYLKLARQLPDDDRIAVKAELFRQVKASFGIPADHKLKVEIDDASHADYLTLIRKKDDSYYLLGVDGKWHGLDAVTTPAPVVRWFAVDNNDAYNGALDNLAAEGTDWDDGDQTPPTDLTFVPGTFGRMGFDEHGNVWIAAEEADL